MTAITNLSDGICAFRAFQEKHLWTKEGSGEAMKSIKSEIDPAKLKEALAMQGGLTEEQQMALVDITNAFTNAVNPYFNRNFRTGTGPLLCCDVYASNNEGQCLVQKRRDNGKLALTGGGILESGETAHQAAFREFYEETGKGCQLDSCRIHEIRDIRGKAFEQRVLIVFKGKVLGTPVPNHEAESFQFIGKNELQALPPENFFGPHHQMLSRYFEHKEAHSIYIPFWSQKETSVRQIKPIQTDPYVNACIAKIDSIYKRATIEFLEFAKQLNNQAFIASCKSHGWGGICEVSSFNDDLMLWHYLEPFKMAAIQVGKLFETHISTSECGALDLVQMAEWQGRFAVMEEEGQFFLPRTEMHHGENFIQALTNGPVEIEPDPKLRSLHENPEHLKQWNRQIRSCLFETRVKEPTLGVIFMTPTEIRSIPKEKWNPFHYQILDSTGIFGKARPDSICKTRQEAVNAPLWYYHHAFSSFRLPEGKKLADLTSKDLGEHSCVRGEDDQEKQFYVIRYKKNETSEYLAAVYETDDPQVRWKMIGNPFINQKFVDFQVIAQWFVGLVKGSKVGRMELDYDDMSGYYYYTTEPTEEENYQL